MIKLKKTIKNIYRFDFLIRSWAVRIIFFMLIITSLTVVGAEQSIPQDLGNTHPNHKRSNSEINSSRNEEKTGDDEKTIGQAPTDDISRLFLRDSEVLLKTREIQVSIGFSYSTDENQRNFRRNRNRSLSIPLSINYGLATSLEIRASLPLLYNKNEIISATNVNKDSVSGAGDLSLGVSYKLKPESDTSPAITTSLDVTTPTGDTADLADLNSLSTGSGFWRISTGVHLSKSIDPAVVFFNAGYQYTFDDDQFGSNIQPGEIFVYGFGWGLSVNSLVAFSVRISGSYQKETELDNKMVRGSSSEPISFIGSMSYRLNNNARLEAIFGLGVTDDARDMNMGFSYIWNFQ